MPPVLPHDLRSALEALEADGALRAGLGASFCQQFLEIKRAEWLGYAQHISAWELNRYADYF